MKTFLRRFFMLTEQSKTEKFTFPFATMHIVILYLVLGTVLYLLLINNHKAYRFENSEMKSMYESKILHIEQYLKEMQTNNSIKYQELSNLQAKSMPQEKTEKEKLIESAQSKLMKMKMRLSQFYMERNKFPQTIQELESLLGQIPIEDVSGSNRVVFDKDGNGGWFYDSHNGNIEFNN